MRAWRRRIAFSALVLGLYMVGVGFAVASYNYYNYGVIEDACSPYCREYYIAYNASSFSLLTGLVKDYDCARADGAVLIVPVEINGHPAIIYGLDDSTASRLGLSGCVHGRTDSIVLSSALASRLGVITGDSVIVGPAFTRAVATLGVACIVESERLVGYSSWNLAQAMRGQPGASILIIGDEGNVSECPGIDVIDPDSLVDRYRPKGWGMGVMLSGVVAIVVLTAPFLYYLGRWMAGVEGLIETLAFEGVPVRRITLHAMLASLATMLASIPVYLVATYAASSRVLYPLPGLGEPLFEFLMLVAFTGFSRGVIIEVRERI